MLHIHKLRFGYNKTPVLHIENLEVSDNQNLLIQGPSGSGKSSLLGLLAGFHAPEEGEILLNTTNLAKLSGEGQDAFRGKHIGFVFQQPHLVSALTVLQNILLVPYMAGLPQDRDSALSLLQTLGIAKFANSYPAQLSQGQQQRVGVARALIHKPAFVLADEPTSSLDDTAAETTINLLLKTAKQAKAQLIVATHDARITSHFNQKILLEAPRS